MLLCVLVSAVGLLPWSALARAGAVVGWLAGSVLRIRRAAVVSALRRASIGDAEAEAHAMYAGLGAGLLELLWLGAARVLATRGQRLAVVVKPVSVGVFHAFCTNLRRACGLELIAPEGALRAARSLLLAGDVVAMPIDQVPDRAQHGLSVSFLGAPALADRAPAVLARSVGATLIVVGATRDGRTLRAHLLAELAPPAREASRWIPEATREATRALETFVRRNPSSWLWLHRRWRAPLELRTKTRPAPLVATGYPG